MPFKSLSSPRRAASLSAEIRGAAILTRPSVVVAMVSADPVRLAIQPASGTARTLNVSLRTADDVGFLSKDVALVRSDDEVWALIDISHTPKMEQVARDAKLMCSHPAGESALVLGWDGTATALALNRTEVVPRKFALRGTVRTLEIGATETFAVVDVGEGGELRVHPGPTPEPGAKDRAPLPRAAMKLDRLHGGNLLSVVYQRGASELCVVVRKGGKLEAKMVTLRGAACDAAVIETSLFVAYADGRVELYDRDAIAAAADEPIAPTHALALGAPGEPRVLLPRGATSLWVGTSAGEVVELTVNKKGPAI